VVYRNENMRIIAECTPQWDNNEVKETIHIMGDGDQRIGLLEQRTGRYKVDSYRSLLQARQSHPQPIPPRSVAPLSQELIKKSLPASQEHVTA
jgi:hypothetical protein